MTAQLSYSIIEGLTGGNWITEPVDYNQTLIGGAFDTRDLGDADIFLPGREKTVMAIAI